MQNLYDELTGALAEDERLTAEGKLLKNKVVELTLSMDAGLIGLLLKNPSLKKHFFTAVGAAQVFDKESFHRFVSNKAFLPDSYTSFKNKIGLSNGERLISETGNVVLSWPYKDCVLEGGQDKDDAARDEVFWNETLAPDEIDRLLSPKALQGFARHTKKKGASGTPEVGTDANFVIKGNNLVVLHTLLQRYSGKVKLIYIDPPYNTDSDSFRYNDSFSHSTWLTFMRNRLTAARVLLKQNGVIAISIDQNEAFYLKVLSDEIFGRPNFIAAVTVQNNPKGRVLDRHFSTSHEYMLFYSKAPLPTEMSITKTEDDVKKDYKEKDDDGWFRALELRNTHSEFGKHNRANLFYPLYVDPADGSVSVEKSDAHTVRVLPVWDNGFEGCWTWGKKKAELQEDLLIARAVKGKWKVYRKSYSTTTDGEVVSKKLKTIWMSKDFRTDAGQKTVDDLIGKGKFRSPKAVGLLKTVIDLATESNDGDIVLDFFAGSGTTAQALLELNREDGGDRKFILCEQMNYVHAVTIPRIKAVLESESFTYFELATANERYTDDIAKATSTKELLLAWDTIKKDGFLSYRVDSGLFDEGMSTFKALPFKEQKRVLTEMLDKNMLYVPLEEIEDKRYKVSASDKALTSAFFSAKVTQ